MKIYTLLSFFIIAFLLCFLSGCGDASHKPNKIKIIEERDPVVKTIEEHDSMVVYSNDSVKKIKW